MENSPFKSQYIMSLDVDGTIYRYDQGYQYEVWGDLIPGMFEFIKDAFTRGFIIRLYSARADSERLALQTRLKDDNLLQYIESIQMGKQQFDVFIDDRAINFNGSPEGLMERVARLLMEKGDNSGSPKATFTENE